MGRKSSIAPEQGERLLKAYQRLGTVSAAAREIGVSEDAAARYLKATPAAAAPTIVTQRVAIETAQASLFDSTAALEENYRKVLTLIDRLEAGIIEVRQSATGERYETMVSPQVLVAALKEARGYIDSASRLLELMVSVTEVRRFQQAILDVLASEVDEPTRQRILDRLRRDLALGLLPSGSR
jgi:molybdenum-dependent DNA-binding transcriptional regulator ModE